jgi:hypothetical protein
MRINTGFTSMERGKRIRPPGSSARDPQATALTADAELHLVPALIADAGDAAARRYVEFFTANIRNPHTRRAYARACGRFFAWCGPGPHTDREPAS